MKRVVIVSVIVALAGLTWLVRSWLVKPEEEAGVVTEVAVHVGKITRTTLRAYVTAYGTVEPEPPGERPAASALVGPLVPGVVTAVKCAEGERVEKGATLVQLDSRAADVAVEKASRAVEFAEKTAERQKKLMQVEGTSQKLLLDAEQALAAARNDLAAAKTQQALLSVEAPLAGTVARLKVKPGEAVDLTTVLVELVDLDRLVVSANVPSAELARLKVGQPAEVLVEKAAAPVRGALDYIGPQVDVKTGTAVVRVSLPARSGLRPGQFVALRIVSEERADCLAVPVESVVKDSAGNPVIALVQDDKAVQKPVRVGLRDGDLVEVEAEGLQADMAVVTDGAYGLPRETKIRRLGQ
ncbi:MAG: efflux RND transporter periplasmic adaptor subunit [Candidatus Glassbacteria bacterium]